MIEKMRFRMTTNLVDQNFYFLGSRWLTHATFWLGYYIAFSLIWVKPDTGYFGSFYLEFVLLPTRLLAVYVMLYVLMPKFLLLRKYQQFFIGYVLLLLITGGLHRLSDHFFYQQIYLNQSGQLFGLGEFIRSVLLVNSTVVFVAAIRMLQLYLKATDQLASSVTQPRIEVKANRRTYLINVAEILYVAGMGNYVTYHLTNGDKLVAYGTVKATLSKLPEFFVRLHKSYIVNSQQIDSFNAEDVQVGNHRLPRGKGISDDLLLKGV